MNDRVEFTSAEFKPVLPDASQVNPGRYGAELAFWFCRQLAQKGIVTSYPAQEDWGWFIKYVTDEGERFMWCCSNIDDSDDEWHCFLAPQGQGLLGRNKPDLERAKDLLEALDELLIEAPGVSDVRWSNL